MVLKYWMFPWHRVNGVPTVTVINQCRSHSCRGLWRLFRGILCVQTRTHARTLTHTLALKRRWDRIDGNSKNSTLMILTSTSQTAWLTLAHTGSSALLCVSCSLLAPSSSPPAIFSRGMVTHKHIAWIPNCAAVGMTGGRGHRRR